jgi:hypothetical protein
MYLTSPRGKEFRSSLKERLEWNPKQLCYNHLSMIRNGIAIHTLIKLRQTSIPEQFMVDARRKLTNNQYHGAGGQ